MFLSAENDLCSASFIALPVASISNEKGPECVFKNCCKKYKKGKRCKSCPKR